MPETKHIKLRKQEEERRVRTKVRRSKRKDLRLEGENYPFYFFNEVKNNI